MVVSRKEMAQLMKDTKGKEEVVSVPMTTVGQHDGSERTPSESCTDMIMDDNWDSVDQRIAYGEGTSFWDATFLHSTRNQAHNLLVADWVELKKYTSIDLSRSKLAELKDACLKACENLLKAKVDARARKKDRIVMKHSSED
ncbi:hypothetical protein VNO80_19525 [Phaseolus coccineus]|uniref:Uncharacterized protein n=1 Tax=Phaseolus coccineus TaxID=3886 RepID=A0AAN9MMD7_PHACN